MWFQKKKRNRKKNTNSSYLWWMFLLWLCYTTRTRLNFVSLWCTYVSHKTQDDFFNVLQAMKRVSHVRVGVFPTGTHCRVHPPLSVVCICVVLHSKGNWMVCQCVFYTFFIWVQWDHVETIYDESIKRFFFKITYDRYKIWKNLKFWCLTIKKKKCSNLKSSELRLEIITLFEILLWHNWRT